MFKSKRLLRTSPKGVGLQIFLNHVAGKVSGSEGATMEVDAVPGSKPVLGSKSTSLSKRDCRCL